MKIFIDSYFKEETVKLDFGTVLAGNTQEYTFYILNDSNARLEDLIFSVDNKEIEILNYPKVLSSQESASIKFKWTPSITVKSGLKADLHVKGYEIWG